MNPPYDYDGFNKVVTRDASAAGGATDNCSQNIKRGLQAIDEVGQTAEGRELLSKTFIDLHARR